jgi:acetylornithine deacetylase/succinyl-diaminopimelate desuccinylase-like protein
LSGAGAALTGTDNIGVRALSKAFETTWGKKPYFPREGGSIGAVVQLQKHLGVESVLSGFGLPDCDAHSPNEKLHLPTWYRGIDTLVHFIYNLKA